MSKRRPKRKKKHRPPQNRRRHKRRQLLYGRRRADVWREVGKLLGLVGSMTGATLGQAELFGEPTRHILTVLCIASTAGFGFLLGPDSIRLLHWQLTGKGRKL